MEKLAATPGIESIGAVSSLPLNPVGIDYDLPVIVQGRPRPRPGEEPQADFRIATPDYFRTMRIPLKAGRLFTEFDGPDATPVAIINETMAAQMFPGDDPIGQRLLLYGRAREIVGVIGAVKHHGFSREPRPEMVLPNRQFQLGGMTHRRAQPTRTVGPRRHDHEGSARDRSGVARVTRADDGAVSVGVGGAAAIHGRSCSRASRLWRWRWRWSVSTA